MKTTITWWDIRDALDTASVKYDAQLAPWQIETLAKDMHCSLFVSKLPLQYAYHLKSTMNFNSVYFVGDDEVAVTRAGELYKNAVFTSGEVWEKLYDAINSYCVENNIICIDDCSEPINASYYRDTETILSYSEDIYRVKIVGYFESRF